MLTIKAIRYNGQPLVSPLSVVLDRQGGTLGRSSDNDLVLPDEEKVVSGHHAKIKYENGGFYLIDTSLNGTQITNRNQRVHHKKVALNDRDELRIGDYDLVVSLTDSVSDAPSDQPQSLQDPLSMSMFDHQSDLKRDTFPEQDSGSDDYPNFFEQDEPIAFHDDSPAESMRDDHAINGSFVPPAPTDPSNKIADLPDDLSLDDFFGAESMVKKQIPDHAVKKIRPEVKDIKPVIPPATPKITPVAEKAGASADWLDNFFSAAGIDDASEIPQEDMAKLMGTIGSVLKELVEGMMTVLRGRSELKSHLRVSMTMLKPTENNPLKFSPTVEDALTTFLTNANPGYIGAVEAVREGYDDIKNHQLAINAGVQASLANILKRFDPQHFAEKVNGGLVLQKKAKCWDEYKQAYKQIVEESIDSFFGDHFVQAYERQIDKLRTNRDSKKS